MAETVLLCLAPSAPVRTRYVRTALGKRRLSLSQWEEEDGWVLGAGLGCELLEVSISQAGGSGKWASRALRLSDDDDDDHERLRSSWDRLTWEWEWEWR